MKNKISDLNNHLFAQLERLGEEDLGGEALDKEIKRSKAITAVSKNIIASHKNSLEAMKLMEKMGVNVDPDKVKLLG